MATPRRRGVSSPAAAAALALLLLLVSSSSHRPAHAARPLHPSAVTTPGPRQVVIEVKEEAVAAEDGMVLQRVQEEAANNGVDKPAVFSEATALAAAEDQEDQEAAACEEDDECMQRRLLHDAHLDYIYTQHKGKP
ncbi:phytosulfokines 2 isoform X1 [Brachypodium distachyon]|uniref:Phytosulfokine n=1 Tax=Brachypodium distachyon TaxID=15368 RepID=I1IUE9_BRADI|nr:phytosulfokines 2 isoform X1 [Brachypodium distachyon]KQJ92294.1 hypothetical protein BRADI_4g42720v3 [Brachypodium distachyon]|eukprot:XP_003578917.1 phytosulfokines 2 isoform X1 [Brachypodium distachyon]